MNYANILLAWSSMRALKQIPKRQIYLSIDIFIEKLIDNKGLLNYFHVNYENSFFVDIP